MARTVVTTGGGVRAGAPRDGVVSFRGIPYAAPPLGELRFAAPAPALPWRGVRDGRVSAPVAPQDPRSGYGWRHDAAADHLSLDVHVPQDFPRGAPVVVWIHGGAWVTGSGSAPGYFPAAWVRAGIVVVNINYRLGFEGFGAVPDAPHNRGLLDQFAALEWVAENIAAFGGDPTRVTIAGESAGAAAVAALARTPRGLFNQAFASSIPAEVVTPRYAQEVSAEVARAARVPATREGFAGLPPIRLLAATESVATDRAASARTSKDLVPLLYHPVVDGEVVHGPAVDGADPAVRLLVNANADEWTLFTRGGLVPPARTWDEVAGYASSVGLADADLAAYRDLLPDAAPTAVADALLTDAVFAEPTRRYARRHAERGGVAYVSRFDWRSPNPGFGATHALDVPFWFDNPRAMELLLHAVPVLPLARRVAPRLPATFPTPSAAALARRMVEAFTRFVHQGDPGWPTVGTTQVWNSRDSLEHGPDPRAHIWTDVAFHPRA